MVYKSHFDRLVVKDSNMLQHSFMQPYKGTLGSALEDLQKTLKETNPKSEDYARMILYPPRIIRSCIDHKIAQWEDCRNVDIVKSAINLAIDVYKKPESSSESVDEFRNRVNLANKTYMFNLPILQESDITTWEAMHPKFSRATTNQILQRASAKSILFVALAHGGVAAGLDIFLRYCDLLPSGTKSDFYAVRFSRDKWKDRSMKLDSIEEAYLKNMGENRRIILFDEDISSGTTLNYAQSSLDKIFQNKEIISVVNLIGD